MAAGQRCRIRFVDDYSYQIERLGANGVWVAERHPATGSTNSIGLSAGASFQSNGFAGSFLAFDGMGRPYRGDIALSGATSVSIINDVETRTITISANTGAVL